MRLLQGASHIIMCTARYAMTARNSIRQLGLALLAATGGFYLVMAYTPLANLLAQPLDAIGSDPANADVIVILSGLRYLDGSLNEAELERTVTGVRLYRQALAPFLLFTGGPCCGDSASSRMAILAAQLGVPRAAILLEEHALRTYGNATYSARLLHSKGMESAILVTSPLHLLRARLAFEAAGVTVHPVRASERNLRLVPDAEERISLLKAAMHEYLGLAFYRMRRWI